MHALPFSGGQDDLIGQAACIGKEEREDADADHKGEKGLRAEVSDEHESDKWADDHCKIRRERKVSDARSLLRERQDHRRHRRCRRRHNGKGYAVRKAQSVESLFRMKEGKTDHDEQEERRCRTHQVPLVDAIDETSCERAAENGARLEESHREPCLHLAAAERIHDKDRQCRDHDVL